MNDNQWLDTSWDKPIKIGDVALMIVHERAILFNNIFKTSGPEIQNVKLFIKHDNRPYLLQNCVSRQMSLRQKRPNLKKR